MDPCTRLFAYCRPGFERETLAEIRARGERLGMPCAGEARDRSGGVLIGLDHPHQAVSLFKKLGDPQPVFARHLLACDAGGEPLPPGDRIAPLLTRLERLAERHGPFATLWMGAPDSEEGRALTPLCRALQARLESGLRDLGALDGTGVTRAEVVLLAGTEALTGISWIGEASSWPMGIPRLRRPVAAPSRASLKLEEALVVLLSARERSNWLASGRSAVDLGAAPGGWSRMLLADGLRVIAVDRAELAPELKREPRLRHVREDGFRFRPEQTVDWLLCDMVEQPRRIVELVANWAVAGWCRMALFNLKLPMKKRFEELELCRGRLTGALRTAGIAHRLDFRHLYHDREEVTGLLRVTGGRRGG
ncbi:Ribosomal RNA large subunit methyltransferase M [Candidatus Magnetaquicoccaceae bacterium FCR-1]|uniref:Ribosomal RNA large subunit methyltransferase M n=1 Tax=Candidatus Magnetaquiglobus chichijimensis TaxID=3141448 RepID=A0ABQ0CBT9_9PROT